VSPGRTRVGIDLVAVDAVAASIRAFGERYLTRVYTERELHDCRLADERPDASRLAARFAAKEAAMKVLRTADEALPWRSLGIVRDGSGRPCLELDPVAQGVARRSGVEAIDVSLSHEGAYAVAVVVAHGRAAAAAAP